MADRTANEPASSGRQALVLLGGVAIGFVVGTAAGAPFDIDVGGGHAIFHLVVALFLGLAAFWLVRHGTTRLSSRLAQSAAMALAIAQFAEGVAAMWDGSGDSTAHEIPNVVSLAVLQPMVLVALCVLAVVALRSDAGSPTNSDR